MVQIAPIEGVLRLRDEFTGALSKAQSQLQQAGQNAQALGQSMSQVGTALTLSVTVPLAAIGGASVKMASDFESSFAGVRKTVSATEAEFAALSDGFREMALEIPVNVNELNRIGEAAGQLGIRTENIESFTRTIADLGVTTNLTVDEAATALARLANITGLPQTEFDRLGSTIVALGNTFATTEAEIVGFGLRMAGAGEIAGLAESDILAIGAAMSSVGVEAEAGGTAVQKVLLGMTQAVAEGSAHLDVFAATAGMSAAEFARAFEEDAAGAFTAFVEGLGQQGNEAFNTLEALELQDQRLIRSFLSLAGAGDLLGRTIQEGADAFEENIALTKEAEQRYKTFASQVSLLWNEVQDLGIELGTALIPVLLNFIDLVRPLLDALRLAVELFAALPQPIQAVAVALLAVFAAAGPVLFVAGQLVSAWGQVAGAIASLIPHVASAVGGTGMLARAAGTLMGVIGGGGGLMALLGSLGGMLGSLALAFSGPVGVAVAVGAALLSMESFRGLLIELGHLIAPLVDSVVDFGKALFSSLRDASESARDSLNQFIDDLESFSTRGRQEIKAFAEEATSGAFGPLSAAIGLVTDSLRELREGTEALEESADSFKQVTDAADRMGNAFQLAGEGGLRQWIDHLDTSVIAAETAKAGLARLVETGVITAEEFGRLRTAFEEAGEAATKLGEDTEDAGEKVRTLEEIISSLGLVTAAQATAQFNDLATAMASGQVPVSQLNEAIVAMHEQFRELGLLTPELEAQLLAMAAATRDLDTEMRGLEPTLSVVMLDFDDMIETTAATTEEVRKLGSLPADTVAPAIDTLDRAMQRFSITVPDVNKEMASLNVLMESGQVPARQMAEAVEQTRERFERLGVLTPELNAQLNEMSRATGIATVSFSEFAESLKTGITWLDSMVSGVFKLIESLVGGGGLSGALGGIGDIVSGAFGGAGNTAGQIAGGLLGKLGGLFKSGGAGAKVVSGWGSDVAQVAGGSFFAAGAEGAKGLLGSLGSILGSASSFIPIVGPLLAAFGGPLLDGLKALGGKIWGGLKSLFGGVSAAEQAGREAAAGFRTGLASMLDAGGMEQVRVAMEQGWSEIGAQSVVVLRDSLLALGRTEAEALALSEKLWRAEKEGPEAVQAVIDSLAPSLQQVQDAMGTTGLGLTELRDLAINSSNIMGVSVAEAFQLIADGVVTSLEDAWAQVEQTTADATTAAAAAADETTTNWSSTAEEIKRTYADAMQQLASDTTLTAEEIARQQAILTQDYQTALAEIEKASSDTAAGIERNFAAAGESISNTFRDMRFEVEIGFNVDEFPDVGGETNRPPGHIGLQGGTGGQFVDFGSGTPAILHGLERVQTIDEVRGGQTGNAPTVTNINLVVDGQVLAKTVIRNTPRALANSGVGRG